MALFYFDVFDGVELIHDGVGIDLPDLEAALTEARRTAADIARELMIERSAGPLEITIRDHDQGPILFAVSWTIGHNQNP
jgi:hypothetical protein